MTTGTQRRRLPRWLLHRIGARFARRGAVVRILVWAVLGLAVGLTAVTPRLVCAESPRSAAPWGVPAYDIVWGVLVHDVPAPVSVDTADVASRAALLTPLIARAAQTDARLMSARKRIALQNDVWGLVQRLGQEANVSDPGRERLREVAAEWVHALALPDDEQRQLEGRALPGDLRALLLSGQGFVERDSEHTIFMHEVAFDRRRIFRLFESVDSRALASQLVALDPTGKAWLSNVVGELEMLRFSDKAVVQAHVRHLDRAALDRAALDRGDHNSAASALVEVHQVEHIPSLGANSFLLKLDAPVALSELPCKKCHESDDAFSLPIASDDPTVRFEGILEVATHQWRSGR